MTADIRSKGPVQRPAQLLINAVTRHVPISNSTCTVTRLSRWESLEEEERAGQKCEPPVSAGPIGKLITQILGKPLVRPVRPEKVLTVPFGHNIPRGLVRARKKEDVMSEMYQRLAHSSWDCKYHVVFVPKRRRKVLFGQARGTCAHVYRDSSEVSGGLSDRISEREERHSDGPLVWQRAEFHGRALLGPWIPSVHSGL